jgi:hypothetical protein
VASRLHEDRQHATAKDDNTPCRPPPPRAPGRAGVPKAPVPHSDIGDWWTLYDYSLEEVSSWAADYVHDYPGRSAWPGGKGEFAPQGAGRGGGWGGGGCTTNAYGREEVS